MAHHVIHNKLVISSGRWCHSFFIEYNWKAPEATVKAIKTESDRYSRYEGEAAYETMDFAPDLPSSLRYTLLLTTFLI